MSDQTKNTKTATTKETPNFSLAMAQIEKDKKEPEDVLVMEYGDKIISWTTCAPEAIACFLGVGLEYVGHFNPAVIFEINSVPISELEALLLVGFFCGYEKSDRSDFDVYDDWVGSTFESRFEFGYDMLKELLEFHDFEMPETLESNCRNAKATQSERAKVISIMKQIDGPLNQIMTEYEESDDDDAIYGIQLIPEDEN